MSEREGGKLKMTGEIYEVRRKTKSQIRQYARYVRRQFNAQGPYIDIVKIVEELFPKFIRGYNFRIVNDDDEDVDMKGILAYTESKNGEITMYVQEKIYDEALMDKGPARFTLAHEGGHVLMHCDENVILRRVESFGELHTPIENEKNPEWQADQFAAELLAPLALTKGLPVYEIMDKFKVSYMCASNRKGTK